MADQWDEATEAAWTALRKRCCATKPATDATRIVMLGREDFAAVAAPALRSAYEQGKRDEREACAKVAEECGDRYSKIYSEENDPDRSLLGWARLTAANEIMDAIRSRSTNDACE